jgi:acyl carrier protein
VVENFLLSCRVLGRGVEHRVFAWLGAYVCTLGCINLEIAFKESARNAPARDFIETLDQPILAEGLACLRFEPKRTAPASAQPARQSPAEHSVDYEAIARDWNRVDLIRRGMRQTVNVELATIWQDLLGCQSVRGESNFFDLGGHSLKVVLMLMRINESFGVSLGIEDVYGSEVTLERMARRIDELISFGGVGHSEYTRILGAIEAMSEEEAEAAWLEESRTNADSISR